MHLAKLFHNPFYPRSSSLARHNTYHSSHSCRLSSLPPPLKSSPSQLLVKPYPICPSPCTDHIYPTPSANPKLQSHASKTTTNSIVPCCTIFIRSRLEEDRTAIRNRVVTERGATINQICFLSTKSNSYRRPSGIALGGKLVENKRGQINKSETET